MYSARIVEIRNLRKHQYADRLQCTEVDGYNIIVGENVRIGQLMVFFPIGGQLSEAFCKENRLLREVDEKGKRTGGGYIHPQRRNIAPLRLHGEVSEGLLLPLTTLSTFADISGLKEGDDISTLNGHRICDVYIPVEMEVNKEKKTLVRFSERKKTTSCIWLPWGIETIEECAFMNSKRLTEMVIPPTVKSIGSQAFYDCRNLCKVVIPESVTDVGEEAFAHCENLSVLALPESLKHLEGILRVSKDFEIKNGVLIRYRGCLSIVKVPEGVTEIGERAFKGCSSMEQVIFPESLTVIGRRAFIDCRALRSLQITENIKRIEEDAFVNCIRLRLVDFPSTLEYIGDHAFGYYNYDKYDMPMPYKAYGKYPLFYVRYDKGSAADEYFKRHRK